MNPPVRRQRGVTLILLVSVLVLGMVWFTVGAIGRAAPSVAEREARTAAALQAAKDALLAYVALQAADPTETYPGRLPCPEHPNDTGMADEGVAQPRPPINNCTQLGRLPWKTLGIDKLRDADGEPLWYAVATGTWALVGSATTLSINPGLANQLNFDVSPLPAPNVVAVIIAPGKPINTLSVPGAAPAGCAAINQQANRYAVPYVAARFLECGNEAGNYRKAGPADWSNDRSISITAAEVMDAIMGAVAERLQRQVAPAMNEWYTTLSLASWGESFLPHPSRFDGVGNNPPSNNMCGNHNYREGMPPTATVASGTCNTNWSGGSASGITPVVTCTPGATEMQCSFFTVLGGLLTPRVTLTAPRIGNAFRSFDRTQIQVEVNGGAPQAGNIQNFSGDVSAADSSATVQFDVVLPLLSVLSDVTIRVPNPSDAMLADARTRWFVVNGWDRFTYYSVPRAVTANPGTDDCRSSDTSECITVNGMPDPTDRKRLALLLMGQRPVAAQVWPGASPAAYLEAGNATINDSQFDANRVSATFNDRVAACPHTIVTGSGNLVVCGW